MTKLCAHQLLNIGCDVCPSLASSMRAVEAILPTCSVSKATEVSRRELMTSWPDRRNLCIARTLTRQLGFRILDTWFAG